MATVITEISRECEGLKYKMTEAQICETIFEGLGNYGEDDTLPESDLLA